MYLYLQAVKQHHTAYRDLGREIMTDVLINKVIPALRSRTAKGVLEYLIDLSIERMETAAAARKRIMRTAILLIFDEVMERTLESALAKMRPEEELEGDLTGVGAWSKICLCFRLTQIFYACFLDFLHLCF